MSLPHFTETALNRADLNDHGIDHSVDNSTDINNDIKRDHNPTAMVALAATIKAWGRELGFADVRITDVDLSQQEAGFETWLALGYHGDMDYMAAHGLKRARPAELVPGTIRSISVRMDYLPQDSDAAWRQREKNRLQPGASTSATVSLYARGRDYHKVLRSRLQQLADRITAEIGPFGYRVFTDSAPVMEVALAQKAGLGWRGKHTLLLNREAGSLFFSRRDADGYATPNGCTDHVPLRSM